MKIVGYFHLFPPEHNAGSETTVHAALRAMVNRGHQVDVICDRSKTAPYNIDGINVVRQQRRGQQSWLAHFVRDADILVTHLDLTSQAMMLAMDVKKPLVHFVHNDAQLMYWRVDARVPYKNSLTVFNSKWLAEEPSKWNGQELPKEWESPYSIIVHPVVEPHRYVCERGEGVTLANPTSGKGANTFYSLAPLFPHIPFVTAQGGYGTQVKCPQGPNHHTFFDEFGNESICEGLPNVTHIKNDPDIRNIFRRTKVLLMPSEYESYGRVGIEAACAGIPTIAHPTVGLQEAFGDAGIFVDRNDIEGWRAELERLLTDDVYYRRRSQAVLDHVARFDPESEFDRLEEALIATDKRVNQKERSMPVWINDQGFIWKMEDGTFRVVQDGRIPQGAVTLAYGKGAEVPEAVAKEHGWYSAKAEVPQENKMVEGPAENKAKRGRKIA